MPVPDANTPPTQAQRDAVDRIARVLEPEAWAEYDEHKAMVSSMAGFSCVASIRAAQRLVMAYPTIVALSLDTQAQPGHDGMTPPRGLVYVEDDGSVRMPTSRDI